ncbi:MAG: DUF4097 domain-containing protein [Spirosomaceae bacterium]|nr:DUF4097 domain-containing protein [Spirosomataceae bacterium]
MKKTILISASILMASFAFGQDNKPYKANFSGSNKKVQILSAANQLTVEGYNGNEVIIETDKGNKEFPEEAEGLRVISAGVVDNTGTGANVTTEENIMKIRLPKSRYFGNFKVKIPNNLPVNIKENGNAYGKWYIGGLDSELEINTSYSIVNIKGVSGPIIARCGYGKISVVYDKLNPDKPNSISASGAVDVTLPSDTKANLRLESSYGEIFTDFDLVEVTKTKKGDDDADDKIAKTKATAEKDAARSTNNVTVNVDGATITTKPATASKATGYAYSIGSGSSWNTAQYWDGKEWKSSNDCNCNETSYTINGGGVSLRLHSDHGNIYLRKKK